MSLLPLAGEELAPDSIRVPKADEGTSRKPALTPALSRKRERGTGRDMRYCI